MAQPEPFKERNSLRLFNGSGITNASDFVCQWIPGGICAHSLFPGIIQVKRIVCVSASSGGKKDLFFGQIL